MSIMLILCSAQIRGRLIPERGMTMDSNFRGDGRRQAGLYESAGPPPGYADMPKKTANDLAAEAATKARQQWIINIAVLLVVLAPLAAYLIFQILTH